MPCCAGCWSTPRPTSSAPSARTATCGATAGGSRAADRSAIGRGLASPDDVALYKSFDDPDAAAEEVARFYRNYHSTRFVGERLVLRLTKPIPRPAPVAPNAEFGDLLVSGAIETTKPLEGEENEPELAALPRLALHVDRHRFARLKQMIDRLNALY